MKEQKVNIPTEATDEEKVFVKLLSDGKSLEDIAEKMGITKNSLSYKLFNTRTKFQCANTIELVAIFLKNKFIQ